MEFPNPCPQGSYYSDSDGSDLATILLMCIILLIVHFYSLFDNSVGR